MDKHIIKRLTLDVRFKARGIRREEALKKIMKKKEVSLELVNDAISLYDNVKDIIRIERLEINCGNVTEDSFQSVVREKLTSALKNVIQSGNDFNKNEYRSTAKGEDIVYHDSIAEYNFNSVPKYESIRPKRYTPDEAVMVLLHFFATGRLLWYAEIDPEISGQVVSLDDLFETALSTSLNFKVELSALVAMNEIAARRLVYQLSVTTLQSFISKILEKFNWELATVMGKWFEMHIRDGRISEANIPAISKVLSAIAKIVTGVQPKAAYAQVAELTGLELQLPEDIKFKEEQPQSVDAKSYSNVIDNEGIYVPNGGLILLHPLFIPLFDDMGLLKDNMFINPDMKIRAAQILHFITSGREDTPEYLVQMNKILCGIPLNETLPSRLEISEEHKELIDEYINAFLQKWEELANLTRQGLLDAFINRPGILMVSDNNWILKMEEKPWDILLDKYPWTLSIVKLPWFEYLIHVEWAP